MAIDFLVFVSQVLSLEKVSSLTRRISRHLDKSRTGDQRLSSFLSQPMGRNSILKIIELVWPGAPDFFQSLLRPEPDLRQNEFLGLRQPPPRHRRWHRARPPSPTRSRRHRSSRPRGRDRVSPAFESGLRFSGYLSRLRLTGDIRVLELRRDSKWRLWDDSSFECHDHWAG